MIPWLDRRAESLLAGDRLRDLVIGSGVDEPHIMVQAGNGTLKAKVYGNDGSVVAQGISLPSLARYDMARIALKDHAARIGLVYYNRAWLSRA